MPTAHFRAEQARELAAVATHKDFRDLVTLTEHSGKKHLAYFRSVVSFKLEEDYPVGKLIGPGGANLIALTKENDLLYAWYGEGELYLYANNRKSLLSAVKMFKGFEGVVGKSVATRTTIKEFTTSMQDFTAESTKVGTPSTSTTIVPT